MGIKEYGQAASEVELQDNPGPIKNQEGESVVEVTNDGSFRILNESDTAKYVETSVLSNGQVATELNGGTAAGITFVRGGAIYSMHHYQATGDKSGGSYVDGVSSPANGMSVGLSGTDGFVKMRKAGTLTLGVGDASAITIDSSKNATFVANLQADGSVTLGDATADAHVVNGTLRLASEYSSGPSAPADGAGGILYVKNDGKLYFISEDVSETDLTSGGGGGLTHETKSADFTAAGNFFYSVNSSGGNIAVTLPEANTAGLAGKTVDVCHRTIGNTVTINRSGSSDLINGATTLTLSGTAFQNVTLFCTGAEWLFR